MNNQYFNTFYSIEADILTQVLLQPLSHSRKPSDYVPHGSLSSGTTWVSRADMNVLNEFVSSELLPGIVGTNPAVLDFPRLFEKKRTQPCNKQQQKLV